MESYIVFFLLFAVSGSSAEGDLAVIENDPRPTLPPIVDVCEDMFQGQCMGTPCPAGYAEPTCYKRFAGLKTLKTQKICPESCCVLKSLLQICTNVLGGFCSLRRCNASGATELSVPGLSLCNGDPSGNVCCAKQVTPDYCKSLKPNNAYCAETCDKGDSSITPDPLSPLCETFNETCCLKNDQLSFCKNKGGTCRKKKCKKNELTLTEPGGFDFCDGDDGGNVCCVVEGDIIKSAAIKIPERCRDTPYRKCGCFKESKRWDQQFSIRGSIDWSNWSEAYLAELLCDCSKKAWEENHDYFSIRYYGKCMTFNEPPNTMFMSNCVDGSFNKCGLSGETLLHTCVGGWCSDYVYIRVLP